MPRDEWQLAKNRDLGRRGIRDTKRPEVMPFGKYRHHAFGEIPADYRRWVLSTLREEQFALREAIVDSLIAQEEAVQ